MVHRTYGETATVTSKPRISLDAMGGDKAPEVVIQGAERALEDNPNLELILVGDQNRLKSLLKKTRLLKDVVRIIHTDEAVDPTAKVSKALRSGKNTSMWKAIELVNNGEADAVVSAGNTGALMAMSKLQLRMIEGVTRPAIASFVPTQNGRCCILDLGANLECDEHNLVQFAIMGSAFSRFLQNIDRPTVGLLNVGEEDQKGFDYLRAAAETLRRDDLPVNYVGFVEGSDFSSGTVDVIVTDGFTGNIALKTAEGVAQLVRAFLRRAFAANIFTKIAYLFARPALARVRSMINPNAYNGAVFLGLNGISVKSHGGTNAFGYANAIGVAADMVKNGYLPEVSQAIAKANLILNEEKRDENG